MAITQYHFQGPSKKVGKVKLFFLFLFYSRLSLCCLESNRTAGQLRGQKAKWYSKLLFYGCKNKTPT